MVISLAITANNLALLGFASLVAGFAEANIVTAQSAIADLVAPRQRNRYFGYIYMAVSLAYIVGPLGGGKLTDPHLLSWFSDATPFWAVFVLLASTTLAVLLCFRETKAPGRDESPAAGEPRQPGQGLRRSAPPAILSGQFPALSRHLRLLPLLSHVSRG